MKIETFFIRTGQSLMIWLTTNLVAIFIYVIAPLLHIEFDPYICLKCSDTMFVYIIAIGLLFSFPVIFFLIPNLYVLSRISSLKGRKTYAVSSMLLICFIVIIAFVNTVGTDGHSAGKVIVFLLPYVLGAIFSFFIIARNLIQSGDSFKTIQLNEEHS
jgi:hypothetical protein